MVFILIVLGITAVTVGTVEKMVIDGQVAGSEAERVEYADEELVNTPENVQRETISVGEIAECTDEELVSAQNMTENTEKETTSVGEMSECTEEEMVNTEEISESAGDEMTAVGHIPESGGSETVIDEEMPEKTAETSMGDALFIGDSRTVGLADYSGIEGANYFANVGMSVYNIWDARVSIPQIGKVTLEELLDCRLYGKIYIMLGINELGYAFDQTVDRYGELLEYVQQKQPQAVVILMANLHVTKQRSETDAYINNPAINRFNTATSLLADGERVYYLDANTVFDDAEGNLSDGKSMDSAHLSANCCGEWGQWITKKTGEILG